VAKEEDGSRKEGRAPVRRRAKRSRERPARPRREVFDGEESVEGFEDIDFNGTEFEEETTLSPRAPVTPAAPPSPEELEREEPAAPAPHEEPERRRPPSVFDVEEGPEMPEPVRVEGERPSREERKPARERKPPARRPTGGRTARGGAPAGGFSFIMPAAIIAAVATLVVTIIETRLGSIDYGNLVFFLVVFTLAAYFELELKGGGTINLGLAAILAALIALPVNLPDAPYSKISGAGSVQVVWVFLLGTLIVLVTRKIGKITKEDILGMMMDFAGVGLAALIFYLLIKILPKKPELLGHYTPAVLGAAAVCAGVLYLVYLASESFTLSSEGLFQARVYLQSVLRKSWLPYSILAFTGGVMGLIFVGIGMWSLIIVLPMLLIFMYAYNKVAATDQYLLETIRVLSAIPEETGMLETGHAERVSVLAVGVARELGLSPEDTQQIQFAAYLHDIGAITKEGIHGADQRQLTEVEGVIAGGVDIVGKVAYLDVAAEILGGREGLRDRVADVDKRRAVSLGAGILRAVDDFDSLVQGSESREPLSENEALTEMNLERGVKYDSKVLRAISRVLPRLPRELSASAEGSSESSPFWGDQEG
jgi:hypothetical protein